MFTFRALGGASIEANDGLMSGATAQRRQVALLALVSASRSRGMSREKLIGYLWPEKSGPRARASLSQSLYVLRHALGENAVLDAGSELRLNPELIETDVAHFEIACERGDWESAVAVYGGPFLDGFYLDDAPEFERWVEAERDRLARAQRSALEEIATAAAVRGDAVCAAEWWRRVAAQEPESARAALQVMRALEAAGDRAGAIAHARAHSALLEDDYGAEPDPEVVELAERLRAAPPRPDMPHHDVAGQSADESAPVRSVPIGLATSLPSEVVPVSPPTRRYRARRMGAGAHAASVALLLVVLAAVVWAAERGGAPTGDPFGDGARVAVFPFVVRGAPPLDYLGPGLATLLSASLDGAGQLSAVDGHLVLQHLHRNGVEALDPQRAAEHARQLRATSYVLGEVIAAGGQLRVRVRWYDVKGGREWAADAAAEGERDDLFGLADRLAAELWAERTASSGEALFNSAARTTSSLSALKEYNEGERYLSIGDYPAAVRSYQVALALDSTFGHAAYRLGTVAEWVGHWDVASEARERAMRFSSRLPHRERFLIEALSAARKHDPATALQMYRTFLDQNPDDVEALYWSAQTLYRLGTLIGLPPHDARAAFARTVVLEPKHLPALMHLVQNAAWEGDEAALDTLVPQLNVLFPDDPLRWPHLAAVAVGSADPEARLGIAYGALSDSTLWRLALNAALHTQNVTGAQRVGRHLVDSNRPAELRVAGHLLLSFLEMGRGRPRAAQRELRAVAPLDSAAYLEYRALFATPHFLPIASAEVRAIRDTVAAWKGAGAENQYLPLWSDMYPPVAEYVLGVLSARAGDSDVAQLYIAALEAREETPFARRLNAQRANAIRARLAAQRGDSVGALALLAQTDLPTSPKSHPYINHDERNLRPGLLRAVGREDEAVRWFGALPWRGSHYSEQTLWDLMYVAPFQFEKAELLETMGRTAEAAEHYARFVELWGDAEPELQPRVEEARRRVGRIRGGGEE